MKYFVLAFTLFFSMNSFGIQEEDIEYSVNYDSNGRMSICRNSVIVFPDGSKQDTSTPIDPRDLPEDLELELETKWEMTWRIIKTNSGMLSSAFAGIIWLMVKNKISQDMHHNLEELKNASEEKKHEAFSKLEYKRKTHQLSSWEHTAKKLVIGGLSSTAILKCYSSISQGRQRKLIKKVLSKNE